MIENIITEIKFELFEYFIYLPVSITYLKTRTFWIRKQFNVYE